MINKKREKAEEISSRGLWNKYTEFIRELYLEKPVKKSTGKELTLKYLSKLGIVFIGALFTTLTFYFLIDPNGLYNSGLNGLLQAFSKLLVGYDKVSWGSYYLVYYGLGLLTNLFFILLLRFIFKAKLEIISTSIFYVLSQIIWTQVFNFFSLKEYLFSRFNPASWQGLSASSQLSFTLPYYIVIAMVAAIIHTYGYSLIFQAQATPGGLEILTSHFSAQKKSKFSISTFMKVFGFAVIFLVSLINFVWIEDSSKMRRSSLQKEILEELETEGREEKKKKQKKLKEKDLDGLIEQWKEDMKKVKELGITEESFKIKSDNHWLTSIFKKKTGKLEIEDYPQEIDYYLKEKEYKVKFLEKEIDEVNKTNILSDEKWRRKVDLEERRNRIDQEQKRSAFLKYLSYVSNNERLWATMVYIFLSSFLISQIFPRDQLVLLRLHCLAEENRNKALKLLEKFSPTYYTVYHRKAGNEEEAVFVINCHLSKWNHYLLNPYLKQIGKIYTNEAS